MLELQLKSLPVYDPEKITFSIKGFKSKSQAHQEKLSKIEAQSKTQRNQTLYKRLEFDWLQEWRRLKEQEKALTPPSNSSANGEFERDFVGNCIKLWVHEPYGQSAWTSKGAKEMKPVIAELSERAKSFFKTANTNLKYKLQALEDEYSSLEPMEEDWLIYYDEDDLNPELELVKIEHLPRAFDNQLVEQVSNTAQEMNQFYEQRQSELKQSIEKLRSLRHSQNDPFKQHVMKLAQEYGLTDITSSSFVGNRQSDFKERCRLELGPCKSREKEIAAWIGQEKELKLLLQCWKSLRADWQRHLTLLIREMSQEIWSAYRKHQESVKLNEEAQKRTQQQSNLHHKLTSWREQKLHACASALRDTQEKLLAERTRDLIQEEKELFRRDQVAAQLKKLQAERLENIRRQNEVAEELKRTQELQLATQKKENEKRIKFRADERAVKIQTLKREKEALERQKIRQEAALEKLRKYVRPDNIVCDRERVQKPTFTHQINVLHTELRKPEKPFEHQYDPHSFTLPQLLADTRYRMSTALFEGNLLHSDYARKVLSEIPMPKQVPPHLRQSE